MILSTTLLAAVLAAAPLDTLAYTFRQDTSGLSVTVRFRLNAAGESTLRLPARWASEDDLWKDIADLQAVSTGTDLTTTDQPDTRLVRGRPGTYVTLGYRLARSDAPLSHRSYFRAVVRDDWFLLTGVSGLVLPSSSDSVIVSLQLLNAPPGTPFVSSLSRGTAQTFRLATPGLRDVVIAAGNWRARSMTVNGRPVHVLIRGSYPFADSTFARAMARIVSAHRKFWGNEPFKQQLVTLSPSERGSLGGTHYRDAMVLDVDTTRGMNADMLALVSHESFHEWIGGRTVPATSAEGSLKWFTEGVNDYYADRLLWNAGLIPDSAYARRTSDVVRAHYLSSYVDSSATARVRDYWTNAAANRFPYQFGRLVALVLEHEVRTATRGRRGLDDVVRAVVRATRSTRLTDSLILAVTQSTAGTPASEMVRSLVLAGRPLQLTPALLGSAFTLDTIDFSPFDAGFDIDASLRARAVTGVRANGPAALAGLQDGQVITGVDLARGDARRNARVRIKDGETERWISWLPAAPSVRIPYFRERPKN